MTNLRDVQFLGSCVGPEVESACADPKPGKINDSKCNLEIITAKNGRLSSYTMMSQSEKNCNGHNHY